MFGGVGGGGVMRVGGWKSGNKYIKLGKHTKVRNLRPYIFPHFMPRRVTNYDLLVVVLF